MSRVAARRPERQEVSSSLRPLQRMWTGHAWSLGFWPRVLEGTCVCCSLSVGMGVSSCRRYTDPAKRRPAPSPTWILLRDCSLAPPTCMGADVALEQPGPGEGLTAHLTDAGQRVGADVHLEGTQAGILLVTVPAGEGAPSRQVAVQLLMPRQASQRMIRPVAVNTLKTTWDSRCPLSPEMVIQRSIWAQDWGPACG